MGVDPANPDVVYVGTARDGLFVTFDGGASFQRVASVPVSQSVSGTYPGITGIGFDSTAGTTGGRTGTVHASSFGNGVWRTRDAGGSWGRVPAGPSAVRRAAVSIDGIYYACSDDGSSSSRIWKYGRTPPLARTYGIR